jgi:hypothetical protein
LDIKREEKKDFTLKTSVLEKKKNINSFTIQARDISMI